jgi:hypothetical protein
LYDVIVNTFGEAVPSVMSTTSMTISCSTPLLVGARNLRATMHAGRKTVKGRDIKIAAEKVMNRR